MVFHNQWYICTAVIINILQVGHYLFFIFGKNHDSAQVDTKMTQNQVPNFGNTPFHLSMANMYMQFIKKVASF